MIFVPMGDRIVVEVIEEPKTTRGGILIPDSAEDKPSRGTVIHSGFSVRVNVGEIVMFGGYAGTKVNDGERDLLLLSERDILAKIVEETK